MTFQDSEDLNLTLKLEDFNEDAATRKLHHLIKGEKPYFKDTIVPEHLGQILAVKARKSNARMASQSGAFLLFGRDAEFLEDGTDEIMVRRITIYS